MREELQHDVGSPSNSFSQRSYTKGKQQQQQQQQQEFSHVKTFPNLYGYTKIILVSPRHLAKRFTTSKQTWEDTNWNFDAKILKEKKKKKRTLENLALQKSCFCCFIETTQRDKSQSTLVSYTRCVNQHFCCHWHKLKRVTNYDHTSMQYFVNSESEGTVIVSGWQLHNRPSIRAAQSGDAVGPREVIVKWSNFNPRRNCNFPYFFMVKTNLQSTNQPLLCQKKKKNCKKLHLRKIHNLEKSF